MAKEVRLPKLGQTMEEGTIVACRVKVGDEVKKGDVIFEIETDKATVEMESPVDGCVKCILTGIDQTLPVGTPIMVIGGKDEHVPQSFIDALASTASEAVSAVRPEPVKPTRRITEADILKAAEARSQIPAPASVAPGDEIRLGSTVRLTRLQRITGERSLQSKQDIPCFYLTSQVDVTNLVALRTRANDAPGVKVAYNDFLMKAVAQGVEKYPLMTGQVTDHSIKLAEVIHIGLAISVPDGVVAPVVKDVNKKTVRQIARDSQAVIERARAGKLNLSDLEGGCITVSNLGPFGVDSFIPIVVPGQCSILGVGRITDTCVPDNGSLVVRKLMYMTLSVDHKVVNGAYAAQFLDFVKKVLEDPQGLVIDD
jgi:pyruvate dehydrogenase E2 component (dihydrolipoamide acetyltransferase)